MKPSTTRPHSDHQSLRLVAFSIIYKLLLFRNIFFFCFFKNSLRANMVPIIGSSKSTNQSKSYYFDIHLNKLSFFRCLNQLTNYLKQSFILLVFSLSNWFPLANAVHLASFRFSGLDDQPIPLLALVTAH